MKTGIIVNRFRDPFLIDYFFLTLEPFQRGHSAGGLRHHQSQYNNQ